MKKIVTLLAILSCVVGPVFSQIRYTAAVVDESGLFISNNYHCSIRYWQNSQSVAAVNLGSGTVAFCLVDHSDFDNTYPGTPPSPNITAQYAVFSDVNCPNLHVNDLYVVDDLAFFCGGISGKSIYGYFDINDLSGTSLNIYLYELPSSPTCTKPISLRKLVAYNLGGSYEVVSYGYEKENEYTSQSIIVEIHSATASSPFIETAEMNYVPPIYNENYFYDDIVLTSSYVVVLGHDLNAIMPLSGTGFPIISIGQRGSVVADICTSGNYYLPVPWEANDRVAGVALPNDQFAMSYVNDHGGGDYYTRLRVIDIATMKNTFSQEFHKPEKEYPVEMIYLSDLEAIEILQPVTDASNFIQMLPFNSTPYAATMLTPSSDEFKSINAIDGKRFIAARNCTVYLEDGSATIPHNPPSCPTSTQVEVELIRELDPTNSIWGTQNSDNIPRITYSATPLSTTFKGCHSYE